jgi:hypothetical protein
MSTKRRGARCHLKSVKVSIHLYETLIVHWYYPPQGGGVETLLQLWGKQLVQRGHVEVTSRQGKGTMFLLFSQLEQCRLIRISRLEE